MTLTILTIAIVLALFAASQIALIRAGRELRSSLLRLDPELEPLVFPNRRLFALLVPMPGFNVSAVVRSRTMLSARHPSLAHLVEKIRILNYVCTGYMVAFVGTFVGYWLLSGA